MDHTIKIISYEPIASLDVDFIHSNHPVALGDVAAKRAKKLDLPLVFTFHTRYMEYADEYTAAYVPWSQAFVEGVIANSLVKYLNRCQHIVTPSDAVKQKLAEYAGLTDRVTTIPTGIDLEPYRQAEGQAIRLLEGNPNIARSYLGGDRSARYDLGEKLKVWYAPKQISPEVSFLRARNAWIVTASGGVEVQSWQVASQVEVSSQIGDVRQEAAPNTKSLWWH